MTRRTTVYGLIAASTVLLSACAGVPMQDQAVAASSQECKIVYADGTRSSLYGFDRKSTEPNTPVERAYAESKVRNLQLHNPARFGRDANKPNLLDDAQRGC